MYSDNKSMLVSLFINVPTYTVRYKRGKKKIKNTRKKIIKHDLTYKLVIGIYTNRVHSRSVHN